ncbi:hypothetical protein ACGFX4_35025 [Kitasatospora sp. NPDC048365]|uniref:hypothetical protein n=1 Tax=Kitasatospora sp. NPDC048365 TaxID=3364050 RepID=UPI003723DFDA
MECDGAAREPNPWTLPAIVIGGGLLIAGLVWSRFVLAPALPCAFLGTAFACAGLRRARRTGGGRLGAWTGLVLCAAAVVAGAMALTALAESYDGL